MTGTVYLIGAGPGDPGLLTLRGAELLAHCDVVLYDALSNDALLSHAGRAEKICVGKHGQSRIWTQTEICAEILRQARAGKRVVRLKGGDPAVFARTAEEIDAVREAGIPFEVVPGITAALAAGSFAGIPITHRGLASAVALVTGHEEPHKSESALDWNALAKFPGTLVIYMGVTTASTWMQALLHAGKDAATPTAIVRRCSHPDQLTIHCRLDEVADRLTPASRMRPPVIVIIGPVTELASSMSWFDRRPLFGLTVLVTRPMDQAEELAAPLRELGASVMYQPLIEISPPRDWLAVDACIETLACYDTIVFSSVNGVHSFFQRLLSSGKDLRAMANLCIAAVGSKTQAAIEGYHLRCDVVPDDFRAESLVKKLLSRSDSRVSGQRFLLVRASRGGDVLERDLQTAGGIVTTVVAYEHSDVVVVDPEIAKLLDDGKLDWVTVTSSQSARNLVSLLGPALRHTRIASLSPVTSETLQSLGMRIAAQAETYTMSGLAEAIRRASRVQ